MLTHWIISLTVVVLVLAGAAAGLVINNRSTTLAANDQEDATQQRRNAAAKSAAQSGEVALKLLERRKADLATKATTPPTAPPTTQAPTTTVAPATPPPTEPPPPINPCPKSPQEAASAVGGNADSWSTLPETDGQGWKYEGATIALKHPGYGRLDTPLGQISSGTVSVSVATLWCQATGGDPAESLATPAASNPAPTHTHAAAPKPSPATPAPTPSAPEPEPVPVAPLAPSCPAFGGVATSPIGDGGCKYSGSEVSAPVPDGWSARFRDATTVACSGVSITTSSTSLYPASELGCNFSGEPQAPPAPAPGPAPAPTPPPSGGACPSFAGIATSPLNDGTGGCKLALQSTNVSGKVPSGWKMVYWTGTATAEAGPGTTVDLQEGTLYPV